jgi:hypothetical protein
MIIGPCEEPPDLKQLHESLTWEGRQILDGYVATARRLVDRLTPVQVRYGFGHERRITHNRKGRRADGSSYFMREEDRLRLGEDFIGDIDDDVFVVGLFDAGDAPVCFLTQFTGHPVTAHHIGELVIHGEFPQVACDVLSGQFGGVPTAFLQGCAGNSNSKGLLSAKPVDEKVRDAERHGRYLGETFIAIAANMVASQRTDMALIWRTVELPFDPLPSEEQLRRRIEQVESHLARCDAGDEAGTRACDGLNFPLHMSLSLRKALVEPVHRWLHWALRFHLERRLDDAPTGVSLPMAALRLGDVGIVGMPGEPFHEIGRQIKRLSPLPITIPCGYMNDSWVGYVPDSANCRDLDYISGYYRYGTGLLPYRMPAGDALAHAATDMFTQTCRKGTS